MLREICSVSDRENDDFVGIRFLNGQPNVVFPRGFALPEDEKQLRRDVLRLIATIGKFSGHKEGDVANQHSIENPLSFPVISYQFIIYDFLAHGYHSENEVRYLEAAKGKINWKRTIQKERPQLNCGNVVYLNFVVKTNRIQNDNLITRIHEYCVYDSFQKLGWLYLETDLMPKAPSIPVNKKMFISALRQEMSNTFNEKKRHLFQSMINTLSWTPESASNQTGIAFGVYRFDHVWEGMIDYVFGDDNKSVYYPRARWKVLVGHRYETASSELKPDTVVKVDDKLYILDAKYYKFGITFNPFHLPPTDSIQKQITYGEYVKVMGYAEKNDIFNAFILPFNSGDSGNPYRFAAVATADWKTYSKESPNYEYVLGLFLDTAYIIRTYAKHNLREIERITSFIEKSLSEYRASYDQ